MSESVGRTVGKTVTIRIPTPLRSYTGGADQVAVRAASAGVGTGGTLTGLGRRLRRENPVLLIAAAIPETFPGIEGLKPLGQPEDIVPPLLDMSLIDRRFDVSLDQAAAMCRRLAGLGLYVGPSSGAFVDVALRVAADGGGQRILVTVLSDTGERYVSTGLWH